MSKLAEEHRKNLQSIIRKNNIFGEREDYVIKAFLDIGGVGAFYSPYNENLLLGRTDSAIIVACIKHLEQPGELPGLTAKEAHELAAAADAIHGVAIYGVDIIHNRRVKWFDLSGKKLHNI